ncbi:hypothetical protein HJC23_008337 [Cyclotella cryptica]|uniref:Copper transporter n=1 Tax=Cyclotella cryptica TaxID=29204 RepID=A0ABD3Q4I9_9STRA
MANLLITLFIFSPISNAGHKEIQQQALTDQSLWFKMSFFSLVLPFLLLLVVYAEGSALQHDAGPKISIRQLQEGSVNLHKMLHESGGVLRISVNHPTLSHRKSQELSEDSFVYNVASFRKDALSALCTCSAFQKSASFPSDSAFEELMESHPSDVQQILLPDGSTRLTLATATVGFGVDLEGEASSSPLQLPSWFKQECGHDQYESMENLRDAVSHVVDLFVRRLDAEKQREQSYRQTLQSANHLEHFHIYFKEEALQAEARSIELDRGIEENGDAQGIPSSEVSPAQQGTTKATTLDYHTDAGFFLSFVPAMNCHSHSVDESSFYIKPHEQPMQFDEDEVVILMGAGAQHWMNNNNNPSDGFPPFVAAPHALRLLPGAHRAWYGKMHLLPSTLMSNTFSGASSMGHATSSSVKYGDVLPTFQLENYKAYVPSTLADGCGVSELDSQEIVTPLSLLQPERHRRRLQHVGSPADCNNETKFFCWYQCLSIPNANYALDYLRDGYSLYCLDPSKLSGNSVADAAAPCQNGFTHNSNCLGSWQTTDENLPGHEFPNYAAALERGEAAATYPDPDLGDQFCYGGTSMYMDGFNWIGSTCVIYLFPQWILSTPGKLAAGCIGSILFGILLEFVLWKRRSVYTMTPGRNRLILSVLVYGLQLTMGYFVMLVIMTYSGPLFISTIGGMMLGHALYNAQDSFVKWKSERQAAKNDQDAGDVTGEFGPTERSSTELPNSYHNITTTSPHADDEDEEAEFSGGCCGMAARAPVEKPFVATEKSKLKDSIPEGVTPCCQYTL